MSMKANTIAKRSIITPPGTGTGEIPSEWVTDPVEYDAGNTGDGLVTGFTIGDERQEGTYSAVCKDIGTPALWDVFDPYGVNIGIATTGVEFSTTEITFTIGVGATPWAVNDAIDFPVRDASWIPYFGDGSDGDLLLTGNTAINNIANEVCVLFYNSVNLAGFDLTLQNPGKLVIYSLGNIENGSITRAAGMDKVPTIKDLEKIILWKKGNGIRSLPLSSLTEDNGGNGAFSTFFLTLSGQLIDAKGKAGTALGMCGGGASGIPRQTQPGYEMAFITGKGGNGSFLSSGAGSGMSNGNITHNVYLSSDVENNKPTGTDAAGDLAIGKGSDSVSSITLISGGTIANLTINATGIDSAGSTDNGASGGGAVTAYYKTGLTNVTIDTSGGLGNIISPQRDSSGGMGYQHLEQIR